MDPTPKVMCALESRPPETESSRCVLSDDDPYPSPMHVPIWALALMLGPAIIVSAFYAYTASMKTWIIDATLVIAVTFFGTSIAAAILPWRKKSLYQNSAIAKYKWAAASTP